MQLLLNICIYLPLVGIAGILVARNDKATKWISLLATSATFLLSLPLLFNFDIAASGTAQYLTETAPLIGGMDIKYLIGLDGLSLLLFMLTTLMGPIVILSSWDSIKKHLAGYYSMLLLLQTASMGVFASLDLIVFYVFFELSLIPMYFLIGIWGGKNRIHATVKFFIYTLVGSLIMLVGLIYLGYDAGSVMEGVSFSTDWRFLSGTEYTIGLVEQTYLFAAFALAFCIKVPLFPFHTWLPYAHTEAPTAGSVVLAAIMLKMGTYGLLRVCLPVFPNAFAAFAPYMAALAVIGIIYGALVAMVQKDVKKLVAYSSVSHLGFVVLGLFAVNVIGVQGALIQMVNHGLSTGALFLIVGMIYDRRHTRMIEDFGGIAKVVPIFAVMFMIATLASIGLPGLNGFIGEFLILNGAFNSSVIPQNAFAVFAALGVILAAVYMLWMYQRVMFGPLKHKVNEKLQDLNAREIGILVPLIIFMVWIGIRPVDFTRYSEAQVNELIEQSQQKRIAVQQAAHKEELPGWASTLYDVTNELASKSQNK
ncbi:complex I subunit 4 family protein [Fodinibius salsisoli]|uniref:NADH-quinone oxidoreductase subunit M n=1 Tax=Fodinibius salsisoli TaxID=2820877 RepID=A0ABT3PRA1_9BACT|nr:NADH-quinone oxidoreductase subunit M [Fodinibius salsisoli]MCW9708392.1 NADH-quinone oxidoreductase subunit M [Fodinibius salsisoli]